MPKPATHFSALKKTLTVLTVSSALAFGSSQVVLAQQDIPGTTSDFIQLTAIPPRLGEDFSIKGVPGETLQVVAKVKNSSSRALQIKSYAQDFIVTEEGEQPVPVTEETPNKWSLAKWTQVFPESQELQPGETGMVNILIEVPEDALPGGRYAMVVHEPMSGSPELGQTQASISQQIGTLLYLKVDGPINEEAYLTNVQFPSFLQNGPVAFSFQVDNRSDIHIRPNTTVEIKNMFGQLSGVVEIEPQNVFPYTQRKFSGEWNKIWGFGKYTAIISANYGSQGQITRAVASFWLIPLQLLLAAGVGFATLVVLAIAIRRYARRNNNLQEKHIEMLEEKIQQLEKEKVNQYSDNKQE